MILARNKAIFDADILIHLAKTGFIDNTVDLFEKIYISDYVYKVEVLKDTPEAKKIEKLKNSGKIVILEYQDLTKNQKVIYKETIKVLEDRSSSEAVNEGEKITAGFAKACNVYYYMSDDSKAASHIATLTGVNVIFFCDLLYLYIAVKGTSCTESIKEYYNRFIQLYDVGRPPRIIKDIRGSILCFKDVMGRCYDRFDKIKNLRELLELLERLHNKENKS